MQDGQLAVDVRESLATLPATTGAREGMMRRLAQERHGTWAEPPKGLNAHRPELVTWAVVITVVVGPLELITEAASRASLSRGTIHVGGGKGVDVGHITQDPPRPRANVALEIPARCRPIGGAGTLRPISALDGGGDAQPAEVRADGVPGVVVAALHEIGELPTAEGMGHVVPSDVGAAGTGPGGPCGGEGAHP